MADLRESDGTEGQARESYAPDPYILAGNPQRRERGARIVEHYLSMFRPTEYAGEDADTIRVDLLADFMQDADALGLDADDLWRRARAHHDAEVQGN